MTEMNMVLYVLLAVTDLSLFTQELVVRIEGLQEHIVAVIANKKNRFRILIIYLSENIIKIGFPNFLNAVKECPLTAPDR